MPRLRFSQTIDRPVGDVFSAIVDLTSHPRWDPTTKGVRKLTDGEIGEGTRFEIKFSGFGKQELELTEYEQNRTVRFVPRSAMMTGGHRFTVTAVGDGTRLDHDMTMALVGPWKLLSPLMGYMGKRQVRQSAAALKRHLESQS